MPKEGGRRITHLCKETVDGHHFGYDSSFRCIFNTSLFWQSQLSVLSLNLLVVSTPTVPSGLAQVSFGPAMVQDGIDEEQVEPQHILRRTNSMHPFSFKQTRCIFHPLRSLANENFVRV